jgi:hypothetical protein
MGMEAIPARRQTNLAWDEPEWVAVRQHWPRLSAADKLAWAYLWQISNRGLDEISVTGAMVASDYGVSGDAGTDRLNNLYAAGLFGDRPKESMYDRRTGRWRIQMPNPFDVGWRLVKDAGGAVQREFEFLNHLQRSTTSFADDRRIAGSLVERGDALLAPPAAAGGACGEVRGFSGGSEEPPEDPRRANGDGATVSSLRESNNSKRSSIFPSSIASAPSIRVVSAAQDAVDQVRGTSGGSSADEVAALAAFTAQKRRDMGAPPAPPSVSAASAKAMEKFVEGPGEVECLDKAEDLKRRIVARINCPNTDEGYCLRIAWMIVEREISSRRVFALLANLDTCQRKGLLNCPRSAYFASGMRKIFKIHNIRYEPKKPR